VVGCAPPVGVVACRVGWGWPWTGHPRSLAFGFGPRTQIAPTGSSWVGRACRMVVGASRWPGLLLGLVFKVLEYRFTKLTGRTDGGIVGAQASGDARALRRPVGFVISLTLRVLTHTRYQAITDALRLGSPVRRPSPGHVGCRAGHRRLPLVPARGTTDRRPQQPRIG
jgi:hypothetical protein